MIDYDIEESKKSQLTYKMYSLVLYNIKPIQQGIQTAHAIVEYAQAFGHRIEYQKWAQVDKTIIVLDGGSTITLKKHLDHLLDNKIVDSLGFFKEPDLNDAITAVCFLADERVWDREKYPDELIALDDDGSSLKAHIEKVGGIDNYLLRKFFSENKFKLA